MAGGHYPKITFDRISRNFRQYETKNYTPNLCGGNVDTSMSYMVKYCL